MGIPISAQTLFCLGGGGHLKQVNSKRQTQIH